MQTFSERQGTDSGAELALSEVPEECFEIGKVWHFMGMYNALESEVIAEVKSKVTDRGGSWIKVVPYGAPDGSLRSQCQNCMTAGGTVELSLHRCPAGCPNEQWDAGIFHCKKLKKADESLEWKAHLLRHGVTGESGNLSQLHQLANEMGHGGVGLPAPESPHKALPAKRDGKKKTKKNSTSNVCFVEPPPPPSFVFVPPPDPLSNRYPFAYFETTRVPSGSCSSAPLVLSGPDHRMRMPHTAGFEGDGWRRNVVSIQPQSSKL